MPALTRRGLIAAAAGFTAAGAAHRAAAAQYQVAIQNFRFVPAQLSVAVGDTITFVNADGAAHTATATATDGAFDTGRLRRGESVTVTVTARGTHAYVCRYHPAMRGVVVAG